MNHALTLPLRPAMPLRIGLVLTLIATFWMATLAVSLAPTLAHSSSGGGHSQVCKCAHCPGGKNCCCRLAGKCPAP